MKTLQKITYAALFISSLSVALAQNKTQQHTSSSIHDDGKIMSVEYHGTSNGKPVNYQNTFTVEGMSQAEKDALIKRIADSLGVNLGSRPQTPAVPGVPTTSAHTATSSKTNSRMLHPDIDDDGQTLRLQFSGTNNKNQPVNYNHSFSVKGLSQAQRNALIKRVADSLGLSLPPRHQSGF